MQKKHFLFSVFLYLITVIIAVSLHFSHDISIYAPSFDYSRYISISSLSFSFPLLLEILFCDSKNKERKKHAVIIFSLFFLSLLDLVFQRLSPRLSLYFFETKEFLILSIMLSMDSSCIIHQFSLHFYYLLARSGLKLFFELFPYWSIAITLTLLNSIGIFFSIRIFLRCCPSFLKRYVPPPLTSLQPYKSIANSSLSSRSPNIDDQSSLLPLIPILGFVVFSLTSYLSSLIPLIHCISIHPFSLLSQSPSFPSASMLHNPISLIVNHIVLSLVVLVVLTLPTRIERLRHLRSVDQMLSQKQSFVRFVSHEIRSPLNVCMAGLEVIKSEIAIMNAEPSVMELIDDVFDANETAILILSDLLHYEHMDAGTFSLERSERNLIGCLEGKLGFCRLMARKKKIEFLVLDRVKLTGEDFIAQKLPQLQPQPLSDPSDSQSPCSTSESAAGSHLLSHDQLLETSSVHSNRSVNILSTISSSPSAAYVLDIDIPRTLQVIRNLVTNAVKFTPSGGRITLKIDVRKKHQKQPENKHQFFASSILTELSLSGNRTPLSLSSTFKQNSPSSSSAEFQPPSPGKKSSSSSSFFPSFPGTHSKTFPETYFIDQKQEEEVLRIEVKDSGVGIAKENQDRVFGEFAQFDKNELQGGGGSGLGLWVCQKIVALHGGGSMGFESEGLGKGTAFYFEIPVSRSLVPKFSYPPFDSLGNTFRKPSHYPFSELSPLLESHRSHSQISNLATPSNDHSLPSPPHSSLSDHHRYHLTTDLESGVHMNDHFSPLLLSSPSHGSATPVMLSPVHPQSFSSLSLTLPLSLPLQESSFSLQGPQSFLSPSNDSHQVENIRSSSSCSSHSSPKSSKRKIPSIDYLSGLMSANNLSTTPSALSVSDNKNSSNYSDLLHSFSQSRKLSSFSQSGSDSTTNHLGSDSILLFRTLDESPSSSHMNNNHYNNPPLLPQHSYDYSHSLSRTQNISRDEEDPDPHRLTRQLFPLNPSLSRSNHSLKDSLSHSLSQDSPHLPPSLQCNSIDSSPKPNRKSMLVAYGLEPAATEPGTEAILPSSPRSMNSNSLSSSSSHVTKKRFLIVDDSKLNRKVLRQLIACIWKVKNVSTEDSLTASSFLYSTPSSSTQPSSSQSTNNIEIEILEADDGTSALDLLSHEFSEQRSFDCIFIDFVMTRMHGPQCASLIRRELGYRGLVLGVTGNVLSEDIELFLGSGANEVLGKPLTKAKLEGLFHKMEMEADNGLISVSS